MEEFDELAGAEEVEVGVGIGESFDDNGWQTAISVAGVAQDGEDGVCSGTEDVTDGVDGGGVGGSMGPDGEDGADASEVGAEVVDDE